MNFVFSAALCLAAYALPVSAANLDARGLGSPGWRPSTPGQLAAGIREHLDAFSELHAKKLAGLPGAAKEDFLSDAAQGNFLVATVHRRVVAADASPEQVYSGLALMGAIGDPKKLDGVSRYVAKADDPSRRAILLEIEQWSAVLREHPETRRDLLAGLAPIKQALLANGAIDRKALASRLGALFDGSLAQGRSAPADGGGVQGVPAADPPRIKALCRELLSDGTAFDAKEAAAVALGRELKNDKLAGELWDGLHRGGNEELRPILLPLHVDAVLAQFGGREFVEPLLEQIRDRPSDAFRFAQRHRADIEAAVNIAAREGISDAVGKQVVDILLERYYAAPSDPLLAEDLIRILDGAAADLGGGFKTPRVREFLDGLLNHADAAVRAAAARSLRNRGGLRNLAPARGLKS